MRKIIQISVLGLLFLLPGFLHAEIETHDGFFLRFQLGSGNGTFANKAVENGAEEQSGSAALINFQMGWSLNENLILHIGRVSFNGSGTKRDYESIEYEGFSYEVSSSEYETNFTGLGVSYYFLPLNIYVSPEYYFSGEATTKSTLGEDLGLLRYNDEYKFDSGTGIGLTVGKEWWVSENWGLGLALFYAQAQFKAKSRGFNVDGLAFGSGSGITFAAEDIEGKASYRILGFAFSATYN